MKNLINKIILVQPHLNYSFISRIGCKKMENFLFYSQTLELQTSSFKFESYAHLPVYKHTNNC